MELAEQKEDQEKETILSAVLRADPFTNTECQILHAVSTNYTVIRAFFYNLHFLKSVTNCPFDHFGKQLPKNLSINYYDKK